MKDIIIGFGAIILLITGFVLLFALIGALVYGFGYILGWSINLIVGPKILFGITFPQFFGVVFLTGGTIAGIISSNIQEKNNKAIVEITNKLKAYRGY